MGNQALTVNPPGNITIFNLTTDGSSWLWAVFSVMALSAVLVALLSMRLHARERTLYLFNISVLSTAAIAYFCMASNLGSAPVEVFQRGPGARQFWYVRYIDWVVTTPLLLTELLLTAGLPINIILSSVFANTAMIICGLIGGLVISVYKWAFFVFGCVAMFWVFWNIIAGVKSSEKRGGVEHRKIYIILSAWILFFWTIYPVAWGLGEGSNLISVTGEMIFYGILDICTKPMFAALTLFLHRKIAIPKEHQGAELQVTRLSAPQPQLQQQQQHYHEQHDEMTNYSYTGYPMGTPHFVQSHH